MSDILCPDCKTPLSRELLENGRQARCPFCGNDLVPSDNRSKTPPEIPAPAPTAAKASSAQTATPRASAREDHSPGIFLHLSADQFPPLPAKSRLKILTDTDESLVFEIPPARISEAWLYAKGAIVAAAASAAVLLLAGLRLLMLSKGQTVHLTGWIVIATFPLFAATTIFLLYVWFLRQFQKTVVAIDRHRIAVRQDLPWSSRRQEWLLASGSEAEVLSGFLSGVHCQFVAVSSSNDYARFGGLLGRSDREWLVERINFLLHPARFTGGDEACISPLSCRDRFPALRPADVPPDCGLVVERDDQQLFRFSYPARSTWGAELPIPGKSTVEETAGLRNFVFRGLVFCCLWYVLSGVFLWAVVTQEFDPTEWETYVLLLVFLSMGVFIGWNLLIMAWGRIFVEMDYAEIRCRWSVGKFGFTDSLPIRNMVDVEITRNPDRTLPIIRTVLGMSLIPACVVTGPDQKLLKLTLCHTKKFARLVGSLVSTRRWSKEDRPESLL